MADKIRVIVADDDELDMRLTKKAIAGALPEAEVLDFDNGESALTELQRIVSEDTERPTLVLFDYKMPRLGCFEVVQRMGPEAWHDIPLVLFSSSVGPTDVARCMTMGVREYVEKPTDPEQYKNAVKDICGRYARLL
ncbi:MAG TPA: response regulator [Fimbriimonas sp.]|nr:response regulator [Fimbriimonas sp.]